MRALALIAALAACAVPGPDPGMSALAPEVPGPACQPRAAFVRHLALRYGEATVAVGLSNAGQAWEILASRSGAWTAISTDAAGVACLLAAGEGWTFIRAPGEAS